VSETMKVTAPVLQEIVGRND